MDFSDLTRLKLIETKTLTEAATSVTFTPLSGYSVYLLNCKVKNATASVSTIYLYVNNDQTAANYYAQLGTFTGSDYGAGKVNTPRFAYLLASSRFISQTTIMVDPDGYFFALSSASEDVGAAVISDFSTISKSATIASITQLDVVSTTASAFAIGSVFSLYGLET